MKLSIDKITPCIQCKNEEYWIHYVMREPLKLFERMIILDTGSTDATKEIIKETVKEIGGRVTLIEEDYGSDANKIGNGRNLLRAECPTHFMFLIDADEVYPKESLEFMLSCNVPDTTDVVMFGSWNVEDVKGELKLRTNDLANKDSLFTSAIKWTALSYPFEGYGLSENFINKGKGFYLPAPQVYAYHMRHTQRSSKNWEAFFRKDKIDFYPYKGPYSDLPANWLGEINSSYPNPYLFQPAEARQS